MCARCRSWTLLALLLSLLGLAACGGGGGDPVGLDPSPVSVAAEGPAVSMAYSSAPTPGASGLSAALPDEGQRIGAAMATAGSADNDCAAIRPFYWELGDAATVRASGAVAAAGADPAGPRAVDADTVLPLASASKWLYAAYVLQRRGGSPTADDLRLLTQRAGYVSFQGCRPGQSVDGCLAWQSNGSFTPSAEGRFFYNGGHFQRHASQFGLGALTAEALAEEWRAWLGSDLEIGMSLAQPAGGASGSAATYARFLRKLLSGELALGGWLGQAAACATPAGCPAGVALYSPGPDDETWHYSLGHWVEDDPDRGDGSFSSPGAFGFYPWIDASRSLYGVVARSAGAGSGLASARCGRLIRQAWRTGVAL
jgi:hypothetical protein